MKRIYTFLTMLFLLLVFIIISCKKDKCADQYCFNGGICKDGTCNCPPGYEGDHCETKVDGYNCINGNCTYVSNNAEYSTISECQSACAVATPGYNCVSGNCTYVSNNAQYASYAACESDCGNTGPAGYNCVNGTCTYTNSNAQYSSLSACQNDCNVSPAGYNCVNGTCAYTSSNAQYASLSACQNDCSVNTSGYNCVNGTCAYTSSNAQYSNFSDCQNDCGSVASTITFVNNTFTTATVIFNNTTKTALSGGGSAVFTGTPGTTATGTAETSGKTNQGTQVGLKIEWNLSYQFPSTGNSTIPLNISSTYFFLKLKNSGTGALSPVYVNYGLQSQTVDNVSIPTDNTVYNIGYYKAWTNSNVRAYRPGNYYTFWNQGEHFSLPFTQNQSVTLVNTFLQEKENSK